MSTINLTESEYYGRTSRPAAPVTRQPLECRHCGSSLAGRLEQRARQMTVGAVTYAVDVFRCGCGRGRHVRRAV